MRPFNPTGPLLLAVFVLLLFPAVAVWLSAEWGQPAAAHAGPVAAVCAWLIWRRRRRLPPAGGGSWLLAVIPWALAAACLTSGGAGREPDPAGVPPASLPLRFVGCWLAGLGVLVAARGFGVLLPMAFPAGLLLLAAPWPPAVQEWAHTTFHAACLTLTEAWLQTIGATAARDGLQLRLPGTFLMADQVEVGMWTQPGWPCLALLIAGAALGSLALRQDGTRIVWLWLVGPMAVAGHALVLLAHAQSVLRHPAGAAMPWVILLGPAGSLVLGVLPWLVSIGALRVWEHRRRGAAGGGA